MTEKRAERAQLVLVTGACGEIGQALIQGLAQKGGYRIVTSDLSMLPDSIKTMSSEHVQGDLVYKVKNFYDYNFDVIFHLAASLSSKAEVASEEAHRINVEGTMQLLMVGAFGKIANLTSKVNLLALLDCERFSSPILLFR